MEELSENGEYLALKKGYADQLLVQVTGKPGDELSGMNSKEKITAKVINEETSEASHEIKLVLKKIFPSMPADCFGDERIDMDPSHRYYEKWRFLKKIGIPTVSSMRIVDANVIVMGDMTADGSEFFGQEKLVKYLGEIDHGIRRKATKEEEIFLSLEPEKVKAEIERVLSLAWNNNILPPNDEFGDLIVHPDGTYQAPILDLVELGHVGNRSREELAELVSRRWARYESIKSWLLTITSKTNEK